MKSHRRNTFTLAAAARGTAGYTLFEIMLVLGIIAVLAGSAIFMLVGNLDVARVTRAEADIKAISLQLQTFEMNHYRKPTTDQGLQALVTRPSGNLNNPGRWVQLMKEVPLDPWGNPYVYRNPGKNNPQGFDLFSLGPSGVEGEGNIGNDPKR